VRIAFLIAALIAALNDLDIMSADVGNAYLNAKTSEKVYAMAGKVFGEDEGKMVIIAQALNGIKSSGAAWRSHFANSLRDFGFNHA
jgi:Reverse transcriptase (RNA-dependent DNA polymerase)